MKPFDDILPEEQEAGHKELIDLLQGVHHHALPDISAEQNQAIGRVKQRLADQLKRSDLQSAGVSMQSTENELEQIGTIRSMSMRSASASKGVPHRRRHNRLILNLLAAALMVSVLLGASLLLFGHLLQSNTGGHEQWSFRIGEGSMHPVSPTVAKGVVYAGSNNFLYALDAASGSQKWSFNMVGSIIASSPEVANGMVYASANDAFGHVYGLNLLSGRKQWSFQTDYNISSLLVVDGLVYISTGDTLSGSQIYALDAFSGHQKWFYHTEAGRILSLAIANGMIYANAVPLEAEKSMLYALDAFSGHEKWHWTYPTTPTTDLFGHTMDASPVVVNGIVYLGMAEGRLYALDAFSGHEKWHWTYPVDPYPTNPWGQYSVATPLVINSMIYIGSNNGSLYALNAISGSEQWSFQTKGPIVSMPIVVHGTIYVTSQDNNLYALNVFSGSKQWSFQTTADVPYSPAVANGMIYVSTGDGKLYAIQIFS